ncbi:MAG: hypothetical protein Q8O97_02865 [bacterium]|nr:hypothetical protein [bacterium]
MPVKKKKAPAKAKKPVAKKTKEKLIGKVEHYFDKIGVIAFKLKDTLKKGDTIRVEGGEISFKQKVASLQIEHEVVASAKKGEDVGLKVSKKAREGYRVFKEA